MQEILELKKKLGIVDFDLKWKKYKDTFKRGSNGVMGMLVHMLPLILGHQTNKENYLLCIIV